MAGRRTRKARSYKLAGLLWCITALLAGKVGPHVPIGMLNICVGMMFLELSRRARPNQNDKPDGSENAEQKAVADDEDAEAEP